MTGESIIDRINHWLRMSITVKLCWIGFLMLILLIPASMIQSLISEREARSQAAILEISSKWGEAQIVGGPILSVPVRMIRRTPKESFVVIEYVHFLPDTLDIKGEVKSERRYRGIYEAVLYNTDLTLSGSFSTLLPPFESSPEKTILWDQSVLCISVPDMRGIKDQVTLDWGEHKLAFNPGVPSQDVFQAGLSVPVKPPATGGRKEVPFVIRMNINGSRRLSFLPIGKTNTVSLTSRWPSPSFVGDFLPEKRDVSSQGFTAFWRVLYFNRAYPQQWLGKSYDLNKPDFGVELFDSVDHYQKTTRSAKYAVLFIFLTFLIFFFVDIFNQHSLHTIQYLLVGFALCLFYLLLLSLSEHMSFGWAYFVSSLTVIGLVTGYARGVFAKRMVTGVILAVVTALYGFLYSLLQMEDYALLCGTLALTLILGGLMYLTRKMDWYTVQKKS